MKVELKILTIWPKSINGSAPVALTSQGIMMRLSHFFFGLTLLFSTTLTFADDEDTQGSFHGEVSDGSELVKYNAFLDRLKDWTWWSVISTYTDASRTISFKYYLDWRKEFVGIAEENGGAKVPEYSSDTLKLGGLSGYRKYAENALADSSFKPTDETCGAAITFVVPSAIGVLLYDKRPLYRDGLNLTKAEQVELGNQLGTQLGQDLKSMKALCAGQDPKVMSGFAAFFTNLPYDLDRVLPAADKSYAAFMASQHPQTPASPYLATISCGMNGQNYNVLACFKDSDLKITTAEGGKLYKIYNLQQAGTINQQGLHIALPEHFQLTAENSQKTLVLTVSIKDSSGKVVYSDQQGQWGIVSVKH